MTLAGNDLRMPGCRRGLAQVNTQALASLATLNGGWTESHGIERRVDYTSPCSSGRRTCLACSIKQQNQSSACKEQDFYSSARLYRLNSR
jgi:hypothetical protein